MGKEKIWLSSPHMGDKELDFVKEAFDSNWIAPVGPHIQGFEEDLCSYLGVEHCAALSSGTAAIHLALIILGVQQGDEVLCSTMTFSASANPIVYQGATPIFVDSEEDTWNISPEYLKNAIEDRIKKGKKPKAIILVHLYGMSAKMDEIMSIANQYDIPVIEDAAEALGSTYNEKPLGTFGEMGVFSFNGNKIITTSGGGALVSDDKAVIEKAKFLSTQARDDAPHYEHSNIGYNYRLSNICAAIGRGQMTVLNKRVNKHREIFEFYRKELEDFPNIIFQAEPPNHYSNRWLTCILVPENNKIDRETIRLTLEKENIESRPLWKPMHLQPVFKDSSLYYGNGVSEYLFRNGLCLPSGSNLSMDDLNRIVISIKSITL